MVQHYEAAKKKVKNVKVTDEDSFIENFHSEGDKKKPMRSWVVVHDFIPKINDDFDKMFIHIYVKSIYTLVEFHVGKVWKFLNDTGKIIVFS